MKFHASLPSRTPSSAWRARWTASRGPRRAPSPEWRRWPAHTTERRQKRKESQSSFQSKAPACRRRVGARAIRTVRLRMSFRPSFLVSSLAGMALGRSCLLANTSSTASFRSSSWICAYHVGVADKDRLVAPPARSAH